ncbi:MAG: hypothetical protein GXY34_00105 [Syntrophomonadaceae bacterium]|nr:hypothetical protein [Syntrophomonadaceae bacterium]
MAVTLTVGTNTYISLVDAEAFFEERLYTDDWDNATDDHKSQALIMATKHIDRLALVGRKKQYYNQILQFPRCYPPGSSFSMVEYIGNLQEPVSDGYVCDIDIPKVVKDACCEQALFLLGLTDYERHRNKQQVLGMVGGSVGNANEYAGQSQAQSNRRSTVLCPEARELLRPYLAGSAVII